MSAWPDCRGTGYVDAPSHSVERSQFGVGPVGVYVCPGCPHCQCTCGHSRDAHRHDGRECMCGGCDGFERKVGRDKR